MMAVDMIIDALVLITSPNVCETCPGLEVSDVGGGVGWRTLAHSCHVDTRLCSLTCDAGCWAALMCSQVFDTRTAECVCPQRPYVFRDNG